MRVRRQAAADFPRASKKASNIFAHIPTQHQLEKEAPKDTPRGSGAKQLEALAGRTSEAQGLQRGEQIIGAVSNFHPESHSVGTTLLLCRQARPVFVDHKLPARFKEFEKTTSLLSELVQKGWL